MPQWQFHFHQMPRHCYQTLYVLSDLEKPQAPLTNFGQKVTCKHDFVTFLNFKSLFNQSRSFSCPASLLLVSVVIIRDSGFLLHSDLAEDRWEVLHFGAESANGSALL